MFIELKDTKNLLNLMYVCDCTNEDNVVIYTLTNGSIVREVLSTSQEAENRVSDIKSTQTGGGGSQPTGTINITENGLQNVSQYAKANVNVPQLDTSDATAAEINIRDSKTAYVNGQKITGSLPVITYPVNPVNPKDWNYQFIAGDSALNTVGEGVNYLVGSYQIATENQPDSWMFEGNRKMKLGIPFNIVSSTLGVTANKIKKGETIAGVTGTYGPTLQGKTREITSNGTYNITPDSNYDGLSNIKVTVDVPQESQGFPPDWTQIGYEDAPQSVIDSFNYAKEIYDNWDSTITNATNLFNSDNDLVVMPLVDTSNITIMSGIFKDCKRLVTIPMLDTSQVVNARDMFRNCTALKTIPLLNTSKVQTMFDTFKDSGIEEIPLIDTSSVTSMFETFQNCRKLKTIPQLNTSRVFECQNIFAGCTSLTSVPQLETSNIKNFQGAFSGCTSLTSVPQFNTGIATTMKNMLNGCSSLITLPELDTRKVTDMTDFIKSCNNLSNESLYNVVEMCINSAHAWTKTLKHIGMSQTQATICQSFDNYQAFLDAGWETGY